MSSEEPLANESDLATRLANAQQEAEEARADLTRQITNLSLKLDAANQQLAAYQKEMDGWQAEAARLEAENTQLKEDQELYKQLGDGQQEAVQRLMERADQAQSRADAAGKQINRYLLLALIILLVAVGAVGFAIYIVLKLMGYL